MKLEHANNHDGEDETNSISDANDDVVEGDRDELEADGEESDIEDEAAATQRLEYPDDEANVEIFQRVRAKERKLRGVSYPSCRRSSNELIRPVSSDGWCDQTGPSDQLHVSRQPQGGYGTEDELFGWTQWKCVGKWQMSASD